MGERVDIKIDKKAKQILRSLKASPSESYSDAIKRVFCESHPKDKICRREK